MSRVLYLTNWPSRAQHGPGIRWCAMAAPRRWEHGEGRVLACMPDVADLRAWQTGEISIEEYRARYMRQLRRHMESRALEPGRLCAQRAVCERRRWVVVEDGDTLLCSCPRPDSPRRTHECHLEWLAPYLRWAGWRVVLYGEEVRDG